MRILHVITGLRTGGAEKMLLKLAAEFRSRGIDQRVISLSGLDDVGPELAAAGIPVEALKMGGLPGMPGALMRVRARLREFRPDIVQTWLYHADLIGSLAAARSGRGKVVWGIRHSDLSRGANKRGTLAVAKACARLSRLLPDGILCNSARAMETHAAIGYDSGRMEVIPNGFETDRFRRDPASGAAWRARMGVPEGACLLGWVGRDHAQKSPGDFIRAAAALARRVPGAPGLRFAMAGAGLGADNAALGALAREGGLEGRLHLLGPCGDMPGLLSALDVFVSSSIGEGFSNALAEAMCCGTPCVATDAGDSAAIVGGTGLVAAPGDPEGLAGHMETLVRAGPARRALLGAEARERILARWSLGAVADRYLAYYGTLGETPTGKAAGMGKGNPLEDEAVKGFRMNPATVAAIETACRASGLPRERFRILDFGCGRGRAVVHLRRLGFDAHGVDVDAGPVGHGRDFLIRTGEAPPDCLSVVGFGGEGLPERAFDFCFSDQVLEHVADLPAVAGALARALRPGGRGLHVFHSRWRPVEPHVRMPFYHWLPRSAAVRVPMGALWLALGFDPRWKEAEGRTLWERAGIYAGYTLRKTHYRPVGAILSLFERQGIKARCGADSRGPILSWLKRHFGSVRLEIEKPGAGAAPGSRPSGERADAALAAGEKA